MFNLDVRFNRLNFNLFNVRMVNQMVNFNMLNFKPLNVKLVGGLLLAVALAGCAGPGPKGDAISFFRAAQLDNVGAMRTLLKSGIDPNLTEHQRGDTGMILALREDANKVFALLLEQPTLKLEATSGNGDTALMMASYKRNLPAVTALLKKGAQVNRPGWSALHYAAASGDQAIMRLLLQQRANIDAASPTRVTPLMIAAREGQEGAVALLLKSGADASLTSSDGMSAQQFAQAADKPAIARTIAAHLKAMQTRQ
jgi:ankyrin repeat protein